MIDSLHCAAGMGFSVLIFEIEFECGAGRSSFIGHCVVLSVVFPSIFLRGGVVCAAVGISKHGFGSGSILSIVQPVWGFLC